MNLLLACDDYIYHFEGVYYASTSDRIVFYKRYLRVFESIRIVARCEEINNLQKQYAPIVDERIQVYPVNMFHGPKQYLKVYFSIARRLKGVTDSIDAAVLRLPSTIASRVGKEVKKKRIPYITEIVYNVHDDYINAKNCFFKALFWKIDYDMRRFCYEADGVSCVTQFFLQKRYFSKKEHNFSTYYSSISLNQEFYSSPRTYPKKSILLISHVANEISFNGRKGHKEIIEMLEELKKLGLIVNVSFAGKDYQNGINQLKQYAKKLGVFDQVCFTGYLSREDLRTYLLESDIFVFPTKAEGLPRVVIEAMSVGLPCVISNVSGNSELVEKDYLFDITNIEEMKEIVLRLINNKDLYESASRHNYYKSLSFEEITLQDRRDNMYTYLKNKCTNI